MGSFEFQVLTAIENGRGHAYGVSIRRFIMEKYSKAASYGALYTTLSRLEKKGFFVSRMGSPSSVRGGRRKKFYKLSSVGVTSLSEFRAEMKSMISLAGVSHV